MRRVTFFTMAMTTAFLVLAFLVPGNSPSAHAQTRLPVCQYELSLERVIPSPRYDQDATLYWIDRTSLLRSQDGGNNWLQIFQTSLGGDLIQIEQFQIVPHNSDSRLDIYMGVHDVSFTHYPFYESNDSGDSWQERTQACSASPWPDCAPFTLRAAGQVPVLFQPRWWYFGWSPLPFGVARSMDNGHTWQMVWEETDAVGVAVSPDYDNDQTVWSSLIGYSPTLGDDFILSHDGGETWRAAGQGLCDVWMGYADVQVSPGYARDRTLLMGFYKNSLFQSKDGGLTWQAIFPHGTAAVCDFSLTGLAELNPRFAPNYPDDPTIYVATNEGLYASFDDGQSWRRLTVSGTVFSLEIARRASASTIEPAGVNQPVSRGPSGVESSASLHQVFLPRVDAPGTAVPTKPYSLFMHAYIAGTYDDYMYRSDDGGATWQCMEKPQVRRRAYLPLLMKD